MSEYFFAQSLVKDQDTNSDPCDGRTVQLHSISPRKPILGHPVLEKKSDVINCSVTADFWSKNLLILSTHCPGVSKFDER